VVLLCLISFPVGGLLSVTDANAVLGRIVPDLFPKIFGPDQKQSIDVVASRNAMQSLCDEVNAFRASQKLASMSVEELALGFVHVANEAMCRPIRNISEGRGLGFFFFFFFCFSDLVDFGWEKKGFSASAHSLACFGGAGGQHACAIARSLGIRQVFIHKYAGILSAYGIGLADGCEDVQVHLSMSLLGAGTKSKVIECFLQLEQEAKSRLKRQGYLDESKYSSTRYLNLRFVGTDTALMIRGTDDIHGWDKSVFCF
jgi:5-oxoprolinase (ATP-hydrolysing)